MLCLLVDSVQVKSECPLPSIAQTTSDFAVFAFPSAFSLGSQVSFFRDTSVLFYGWPSWLRWGLQPLPIKKFFTAAKRFKNRGWSQGYRHGQASTHDPNPVLLGVPTVQTPLMPRHQRSLPDPLMDAEKSTRSLRLEIGERKPPLPYFFIFLTLGCWWVCRRGTCSSDHSYSEPSEVLRVGSWKVLNFSDDHRLPHLSNELRWLRVDMVWRSDSRRPGSGETSSKDFTYNGHHVNRVAIGVSSRLHSSVVLQ